MAFIHSFFRAAGELLFDFGSAEYDSDSDKYDSSSDEYESDTAEHKSSDRQAKPERVEFAEDVLHETFKYLPAQFVLLN